MAAQDLKVTPLGPVQRHRRSRRVHDKLRGLAHHIPAGERAFVAPTEPVNGAAIRIIGQRRISARDRRQVFAFSVPVMRQVLI